MNNYEIDTSVCAIEDEDCNLTNQIDNSGTDVKQTVASGETARLLLDTIDGRKHLLNDLTELHTFLQRFKDDLVERQCIDSPNAKLSNSGFGLQTLQNIIFQVRMVIFY